MCRCNLWFVFVLRLTLCSYSKAEPREQLVKTIRKEADFTPVCSNKTLDVIVMVVCRIRPVRSREEKCLLTYLWKKGFDQECDSRFSLISINQTLFLQLNNLTPENSGNVTCQCALDVGTITLQFNITVEDDEEPTPPKERTLPTFVIVLSGVLGLIIIIILLGFICKSKCHRRRCEVTITPHPNTVLCTEVPDIEPYSVFKENELYLTSIIHTSTSTNCLIGVGMNNPSLGTPS